VAGVVIDRFSRKGVLIAADLVQATLALSLVWPQGIWHAYLVAAGLSCATVFFNPAVNAVIPALTTREQRLAANSVSWSTAQLVQIVGAAVAGGLIALIGTSAAFALNSASFLVSAGLIGLLVIPAHAGRLRGDARSAVQRFISDLRDGFSYARRDVLLSRLLLVQSLAAFSVGATGAMLIVLSERHLRLPPEGFAYLIGAIGVGALLGPLIPNALARDYRSARWLFVPYVVRGIGDVLIAVVTPLPIALVILFVYGLNTSTGMVVFNSTIQEAIPDAMRGRAFTFLDMDWSVFTLLSLAVGGVFVDQFGIEPLFWGGGTLLTLAGLIGLTLFRRTQFGPEQRSPN
jgi:MFS family permease